MIAVQGFGPFTMPAGMIIKGVLQAHEEYSIDTFVMSASFGSAQVAKHWAKLAQTVSDTVSPHGCRILYHNHDDEFHIDQDKSTRNMLEDLKVGYENIRRMLGE